MNDIIFKIIILTIFTILTTLYTINDIKIQKDKEEITKKINSWYNFTDYTIKITWFVILPTIIYLLLRGDI